MKLGIVGKGGVGKTTLSALFAQEYARRGLRVLAIDTDSNPNLAHSLGLNVRAGRRRAPPAPVRGRGLRSRRRHDARRAPQAPTGR